MTHDPLYKVELVRERPWQVWGVYKRDFGSAGGWVLLKAYTTEEQAEEYIRNLI